MQWYTTLGHYNHFIKPALSYVKQPVEEIGKKAVELLIEEIKNPDTRGTEIQLPTELVVCETCLKKTGFDIYE